MSRIDSLSPSVTDAGLQKLNASKRSDNSNLACSTVAGLSGAAGVPEGAASAVCTFSTESLDRLGDALASGYDAVEDAVGDSAEWVGDALDSATSGAVSLYNEIAGMAGNGVEAVGDAVSAVTEGIGSAASTVAGYGALALAAGRDLFRGEA